MSGYLSEKLAPIEWQKIEDSPVLPGMVPAVDVQWLPDMSCKTFLNVHGDYKHCLGIVDDDTGFLGEIRAKTVEDNDDVLA